MIHAIIADDEPLAHNIILKYAADVPFFKIVGQCYKATDAYALLENETVDLIFLDINMPRLKGLDFLRTLQHPPRVIITSAFKEYALDGYELRVSDYLLKPFRFDRFLRAVNAVRKSLQPPPASENKPASEALQLFVKVDKKQLQISTANLQVLESYGNYVKLWQGENYQLTPRTLASFRDVLPPHFVQIHKSFIVNRHFIDYVEGAMIVLRNQKVIPVGKSYRKEVQGWFGR